MAGPVDKGKPLSSWKEISAYLGCDQRTCLRWEKNLGLPVHRVGSPDSKGHVFAYKEELDAWLTARARQAQQANEPQRRGPARASLRAGILIALAAVAIGVLALLLFRAPTGPASSPVSDAADFRIEGSVLVITDTNGRELGRFDSRMNDLADESFYRSHFQARGNTDANNRRSLPKLLIRDINGDGRSEVLFCPSNKSDYNPGIVYCLDRTGGEIWRYDARQETRLWAKTFPSNYVVDAVDVIPSRNRNTQGLLIIARNMPEWPTYAAVLGADTGKAVGRFWNAGRIIDYETAKLGDDRKPKLILAGVNNEYKQGFLAVFDPDRVGGQSPNSGEYHSDILPPGTEEYYILFPRTALDRVLTERELLAQIDVLDPGEIQAVPQYSGLIFVLNGRLELSQVILADDFRHLYQKAQEQGKLPPGQLDESRLRRELAGGFRYWDGARWTSSPATNGRGHS
jgi:hypothetical protein